MKLYYLKCHYKYQSLDYHNTVNVYNNIIKSSYIINNDNLNITKTLDDNYSFSIVTNNNQSILITIFKQKENLDRVIREGGNENVQINRNENVEHVTSENYFYINKDNTILSSTKRLSPQLSLLLFNENYFDLNNKITFMNEMKLSDDILEQFSNKVQNLKIEATNDFFIKEFLNANIMDNDLSKLKTLDLNIKFNYQEIKGFLTKLYNASKSGYVTKVTVDGKDNEGNLFKLNFDTIYKYIELMVDKEKVLESIEKKYARKRIK